MPSCCVLHCTNSSKKKYSVHRLPTDIERRKKWVQNINRPNLYPTSIYYVCEAHFAPEMWERQRVDGKKKLKSCAVPTIFSQKTSTNIAQMGSTSANTDVNSTTLNRAYDEKFSVNLKQEIQVMKSPNNDNTELPTSRILHEEEETALLIVSPIANTAIPVQLTIENMKKMLEDAENRTQKALSEARQAQLKLQIANKIIIKLDKSKRMLIKRINNLMHEKKKLIQEMLHLKQSKNVEKILNDDQIAALCKPSKRCDRWSEATLQKALRLKLSCGSNGYKELLHQGIPLPSERTLRRRLEKMDFEPEVSEHIFDVLSEQISHSTDIQERDCSPSMR